MIPVFERSKISFLLVALLVFSFALPNNSLAQVKKQDSAEKLNALSAKTRIWTGTASLRWYNFYTLSSEGLVEETNTELDLEFRHLWLLDPHWGWGLQGMTQVFMSDFFGNVGLGNIGAGPVLRYYAWQNSYWQFYLQGDLLIGYDLALADALGANRGEGIRYRPILFAGLSHRISNNFGICLEIGPAWEADESFQFDSQALLLDIGIQLFRF